MIVSDTRQFVFLHNPKCAGMALRAALMPFETTADLFWLHAEWNGQKIDKAHLPLFILESAYPGYFDKLRRYFSFMVIRNPFTRAVSAFNEVNQDIYDDYVATGSLSRYRYELNRFLGELSAGDLNGWRFAYRHFVPQHRFAYLGRKRMVDVLIRYEDLPRSVEQVRIFDPDVADALQSAQKTHQRQLDVGLDRLLDHRSINNIIDLYSSDFALFEYAKVIPIQP